MYQRSQPETDSLSLMKDEGSSENFEVWKIFCVEIKSIINHIYTNTDELS